MDGSDNDRKKDPRGHKFFSAIYLPKDWAEDRERRDFSGTFQKEAADGIRTHDLLITNQPLYRAKPQRHSVRDTLCPDAHIMCWDQVCHPNI